MYGAIVAVWIAVPLVMVPMTSHITNIIQGTCVPWGVFANYVEEKAITSILVTVTYLLP